MSGNYGSNRGGGKKDFKADPLKGFLMARSVALSYAKDLCVAGKIELIDIPDYTDKLTILQYGNISVHPQVDKEILRIAARCKKRAEVENHTPEKLDTVPILCTSCDFGPNGTEECDEDKYDVTVCTQYEHRETAYVDDMDKHAANERQREYEEAERNAAEDEGSEHKAGPDENRGNPVYTCGTCQKVYKTISGLQKHEKAVHGVPEGK